VAAAPEHRGERCGVELGHPAACDREDPAVHLDEHGEGRAVGHVHELVRQVRDSLDVLPRRRGGNEDLDPRGLVGLERVEQRREELALGVAQRRVQKARKKLLLGAVAKTPAERLGIALRRRRVGERASVLVNPEREDGCLHRSHRQLTLGQHADERRRQRAILGDDDVLARRPIRPFGRVVVEDDLVDVRIERERLELAESARMHRLDDDQAPDRVQLEPGGVDNEIQLVRVQAVELTDVPVQRARQADDGARIKVTRGQHRRKGVEIRVRVSRDDCFCTHQFAPN
jgi:hypothetical protein